MPQLNWLGDDKARRAARHVAHRLLDPIERVGDPASENLLIQADNLRHYTGKDTEAKVYLLYLLSSLHQRELAFEFVGLWPGG